MKSVKIHIPAFAGTTPADYISCLAEPDRLGCTSLVGADATCLELD